jgi:hypothetical protein
MVIDFKIHIIIRGKKKKTSITSKITCSQENCLTDAQAMPLKRRSTGARAVQIQRGYSQFDRYENKIYTATKSRPTQFCL